MKNKQNVESNKNSNTINLEKQTEPRIHGKN